jgi:hypothetical protein
MFRLLPRRRFIQEGHIAAKGLQQLQGNAASALAARRSATLSAHRTLMYIAAKLCYEPKVQFFRVAANVSFLAATITSDSLVKLVPTLKFWRNPCVVQ